MKKEKKRDDYENKKYYLEEKKIYKFDKVKHTVNVYLFICFELCRWWYIFFRKYDDDDDREK